MAERPPHTSTAARPRDALSWRLTALWHPVMGGVLADVALFALFFRILVDPVRGPGRRLGLGLAGTLGAAAGGRDWGWFLGHDITSFDAGLKTEAPQRPSFACSTARQAASQVLQISAQTRQW